VVKAKKIKLTLHNVPTQIIEKWKFTQVTMQPDSKSRIFAYNSDLSEFLFEMAIEFVLNIIK
jgi:hypothetical protein